MNQHFFTPRDSLKLGLDLHFNKKRTMGCSFVDFLFSSNLGTVDAVVASSCRSILYNLKFFVIEGKLSASHLILSFQSR